MSKKLLEDFTARTGITAGGDGRRRRAAQNKAAHGGNPEGDVFFGVDNTPLSRAP